MIGYMGCDHIRLQSGHGCAENICWICRGVHAIVVVRCKTTCRDGARTVCGMQCDADVQLSVTCATNKTTRAETSSLVNKGNAAFASGCCCPIGGRDKSTDEALLEA